MDDFQAYLQYQKDVAESKLKIIDRYQKGVKSKSTKRTSKIETIKHVLDTARRPLHVSEIIKIAKADFNVNLDRDSIVSGIIKKVKADKIFIRTAPNTFALKQYSSK